MKKIILAAALVSGLHADACMYDFGCNRSLLYAKLEWGNTLPFFPRPGFGWKNHVDLILAPRAYSLTPPVYQFHQPGMPLPRGAVFCRMETYTQKKLGVMFSIHAGGYKERY